MRYGIASIAVALLGLAAQRVCACYYSALNLENPADYYYRYCYAGCADLEPTQEVFAACCTPLAAGATAPPACATASTSLEAQGACCEWTSVPTSDFPTGYSYATATATTSISSASSGAAAGPTPPPSSDASSPSDSSGGGSAVSSDCPDGE